MVCLGDAIGAVPLRRKARHPLTSYPAISPDAASIVDKDVPKLVTNLLRRLQRLVVLCDFRHAAPAMVDRASRHF